MKFACVQENFKVQPVTVSAMNPQDSDSIRKEAEEICLLLSGKDWAKKVGSNLVFEEICKSFQRREERIQAEIKTRDVFIGTATKMGGEINRLKDLLSKCSEGFNKILSNYAHPSECDPIHEICKDLLSKIGGVK